MTKKTLNRAFVPAALLATLLAPPVTKAPAASPKRVVALTPFTASITYRIGIRPVAIGRTLGGSDPAIAQLKGVPVLTLSHPNGPNMEQLATFDPTSSCPARPGSAACPR